MNATSSFLWSCSSHFDRSCTAPFASHTFPKIQSRHHTVSTQDLTGNRQPAQQCKQPAAWHLPALRAAWQVWRSQITPTPPRLWLIDAVRLAWTLWTRHLRAQVKTSAPSTIVASTELIPLPSSAPRIWLLDAVRLAWRLWARNAYLMSIKPGLRQSWHNTVHYTQELCS